MIRLLLGSSLIMVCTVCSSIFFYINAKVKMVKVKVSHSLLAVGAVGVCVALYLGHS